MNVDLTTIHQLMDGFGASHYNPSVYTSTFNNVADFAWRADIGLGLSVYNCAFTVDTNGNGWPQYNNNQSSNNQNIAGDFSQELQAYKRGVRTFCLRVWTAQSDPGPYTWQTSGSATGSLLSANYSSLASAIVAFINTAWNTYGIPWTHVSMMNEPDFTPSSYGQISWTTAQMLTFLKTNLGPALATWAASNPSWQAATGFSVPQAVIGETADWHNSATWIAAIEGDSTALGYTGTYSTHQYFGGAAIAPPSPMSRRIWMTEGSTQDSWDPSMVNGVNVASLIHNALTTGQASAWLHWWLDGVHTTDNEPLMGANGNETDVQYNNPIIPKRAYVLGHWSKFVRPGWHRIDVTSAPSGILATSFASSDNIQCATVMVNNTGSPIAVTVNLTGAASNFSLVTWTTDATRNLLGSTVSSMTGSSVSTTVPANGLVTLQKSFTRGYGPMS